MKNLIIIFTVILFGCQKTIQPANLLVTHPEEWSSTIMWNQGNPLIYRGITIGNDTASTPGWDMLQVTKGAIADGRHINASIELTAWCKRIDINTFISPRHGGYTVIVDEDSTVISVDGEPRRIETTFSAKDLKYANHKISIIPDSGKTFIFHSIVKYVAFAPIEEGDSTIYTIPPIDPIECPDVDTIYVDCPECPICPEADTVYIPELYPVYDTVIGDVYIQADDIKYKLK